MSLKISIIPFLIILSALFSASESAYFSINLNKIRRYKHQPGYIKYIRALLSEKERLLSTILIGNLLVNIFYFSWTSSIVFSISKEDPLVGSLWAFGFFFILLVFSEILPKTIAVNIPYKFARFSSYFLIIFFRLLYPVSLILRNLLIKSKTLTDRILGDNDDLIEDELSYILDFAQKDGFINIKEKYMLFGGVDFDQLKAKTFMTPRKKVIACDIGISREDFIELFRNYRHSKIIVYNGNIENVMGYVRVKDIYLKEEFDITSNLRKIHFFPEISTMRKIYSLFLKYGFKIAAIVDEYGGFQGIITNEDIIEVITGDIDDEFREKKAPLFKVSRNKYIALGELSIRYWNMYFPNFPNSEKFGTLAGYLEMKFGKIPKKGDIIEIDDIIFTIIKVSSSHIKRIMIEIK